MAHFDVTFRFVSDEANTLLIDAVRAAGVRHSIDRRGVLHYASADAELVENTIIARIRQRHFPSWQIQYAPADWQASYRCFMAKHGVPFMEELVNGELVFLLPRKYRPHTWKLDPPDSGLRKRQLAESVRDRVSAAIRR